MSLTLAVLATFAVLRPSRNWLGLVQFLMGWLPAELPRFFLGGTLILTVGILLAGTKDDPRLFAALVLNALAIAALALCDRRSWRAAGEVEAALCASLGKHYRAAIPADRTAYLRDAVPASLLWHPFRVKLPLVEIVRDISYGPHHTRNLLDIYLPTGAQGPAPVLLWVHGGAWVVGHKAQQGQPLLRHLASRGWLCVAINYRLGPSARFPAALDDIDRSLKWIRAHIATHGGDPGFVAICGNSAGGHLATLAGLASARPGKQTDKCIADTAVAAIVSLYGRYDFLNRTGNADIRGFLESRVMPSSATVDRALWERASPLSQVHADAPPFLGLHGTHDSLIPIDEARAFIAALTAISMQTVSFAELCGAQHAFEQFHTPRGGPAIDAIHRFLEYQFAAYRRSSLDGVTLREQQ